MTANGEAVAASRRPVPESARSPARVARFLAVGLSNTLLSGLAFYLWQRFTPGPLGAAAPAQIVAYTLGLIWSYQWNRRWTFDQPAARGGARRFVVLQLALLAASAATLGLLIDRFGTPALPTWIAVMAVVTAVNYFGQKRWVFPTSATLESSSTTP